MLKRMTCLSLRVRIMLFFVLLAVADLALAAGAMGFGWSRANPALPTGPFITAFVLFAFLHLGLVVGIWLLFDEFVAKPINRISTKLRLDAHSGGKAGIDLESARYLGDLAPAAQALSQSANELVANTANRIARETQRLEAEKEQLTALLSEAPVSTILLNARFEIVLYDTQAAALLSAIAPPRLRAPISDYLAGNEVKTAAACLSETDKETRVTLHDITRTHSFDARLKWVETGGYIIFFNEHPKASVPPDARPMVFDFELLNPAEARDLSDTPLTQLCYVPFDTETTGLSVEKDDIVQIGAVRVLNGRIVGGETLDLYVNPGRPIPPASTRIHHVTDADVADAPDIRAAGQALHHFTRDAVLVAHNAPFDIGLLRKSADAMGVQWDHPVVDTVLLSAIVFGTTEEHSLDALCDRLTITIPTALRHTALGDAHATAEALVRLLPLLAGMGITRFDQLVTESKRHNRLLKDLNG